MSNEFIPNSCQLPNVFVDRYMSILTPPEWKVLTYAVRRIFGFNKRRDRISISQFCNGVTTKEGKVLDRGTGLSKQAVMDALDRLIQYGLIVKVENSDPTKNLSPLYELQLDETAVDYDGLVARADAAHISGAKRTEQARKKRLDADPTCETDQVLDKNPACETGQATSVGQEKVILCDRPTSVCGIGTQYTSLNTVKNTVETQSAPAPEKPLTEIKVRDSSCVSNETQVQSDENLSKKKSPSLRKKAEKDARTNHPAIKLIHAVTGKYPPKILYDDLIAELGDRPDGKLFASVFKEWCKNGYNHSNYSGFLAWYKNGGAPQNPRNIRNGQNGSALQKVYDPWRDAEETRKFYEELAK
jgi:hypothetical protein